MNLPDDINCYCNNQGDLIMNPNAEMEDVSRFRVAGMRNPAST